MSLNTQPLCDTSLSFICLNQSDVLASILHVKSDAVGLDNISLKFVKLLLPLMLPHVTYIFNMAITTSSFSTILKNAKIFPILELNNDYKPISMLSFLSKVFENLMSLQIQLYLANNSLLNEKQSGFRQKWSCITAITYIVEDIRQKLDRNCVTFLTLLDHSKAFGSVNHNILCTKLRNFFNFSTNATKLIRSYLTNRYQAVVSGTQVSSLRNLARGVPQGSVLGPLLFSIYVNDLPSILSECEVHLYADDVQIFVGRPQLKYMPVSV